MKILHVINSLHFGGAEKLLFDTIPELKKRGLEVDLLVLNNEETYLFQKLKEEYNVTVICPKNLKSVYNLSHIFFIRRYLKNYDIVHVHLFPSLYWVVFASVFKKIKAKLLFTEHSTNNRRRSNFFLKIIDKYVYKKYSKIIAISEGVKDSLETYLGENFNIEVINNGVNVAFFKDSKPYLNSELNLPEEVKIVMQVSNFFPQKDQDTLLKAVALLPSNVHLVFVGIGILLEEKKQLATSLGIKNKVHFLGNRNDVNRLLKTADICVLSSNYEGFGIAIVEAMAAGKPSLASNVSGLAAVVGNSELLFQPKNHQQLKEKLENLLSDTNYYNRIAKQCSERVKEFDISLMIDAHINAYKALLK